MPTLNNAQRLSLTIGLRQLASTCAEIERILTEPQTPLFVRVEDDLTAAERTQILCQISDLRGQIMVLAAEWDLAPSVLDVRRHILGMLSVNWADLVDISPTALRRYGAVDADAAALLQPTLDHLITGVEQLLSVCQHKR